MSIERPNVINFPRPEIPLIIGNNALKQEYWERPQPIGAQVIDLERYRNNPLRREIDYLDRNWMREELQPNWWEINDIGFSSKRQMRLLEEGGDINTWAEQTAQDLLGFGLEYLKQGTVFPFEYKIQAGSLVDKKYGDRRMVDTVDPNERGGAVLDSLQRIESYLIEAEEGSTAIMVSPPGHTGLTMDDGSRIVYTDTMVFYMQKRGDKVIGTTIRTDLNLPQARALIERLGQELPEDATPKDCTKALTLSDGKKEPKTIEDLIDTLQDLKGSRFSYKDRTFNSTRLDIQRREELYFFDQITHVMIDQFKEYISTHSLSKKEIQKAMAATFLRISNHLLIDKPKSEKNFQKDPANLDDYQPKRVTRGVLVNKIRALPGCMGGGQVTSVNSPTFRSAQVEEDWDNKATRKYDKPGPCKQCGAQVGCGPCGICKSCNDSFEMMEAAA